MGMEDDGVRRGTQGLQGGGGTSAGGGPSGGLRVVMNKEAGNMGGHCGF